MKHKRIISFARRMRREPTPAEEFFWEKVRRRDLGGYKFLRQYIISHQNLVAKSHYFIADFYCAKAKLIVEIDGGYHKDQKEEDKLREEIISSKGFRVIRFTNEEVLKNWEGVEDMLLKQLTC